MKFVIPSFNRQEQIKKKTLAFLLKHKIKCGNIYIFAHPDCYDDYKSDTDLSMFNIIKSVPGIKNSRNFIIDYFDEDEQIVSLDDDIEDIMVLEKGKKNQSIKDFKFYCAAMFECADGGMWGLNSNVNNYYVRERVVKKGLYFIIGSCYGFNNKKHTLTLDNIEDFEKAMWYYLNGHNVVKDSGHGIKTKYWKNKGGINAQYGMDERIKVQKEMTDKFKSKYGEYVYTKTRKNGLVDMRFKNRKTNKVIFKWNDVKEF